ncbi:predicted protein [Naegleria gruberi]|uniref:Predicted protein n=1 Tax=Naegleria gruberi TaxID=5762 RepID=D2VC18_NAEGR|nr:uncharacterized protein NAEGRDRAFT_66414 [Naegleria gruberi]EFC45670.1 predicted protein [Naegleria gruberi]|eukprot:XP_002678414.1 predicted protein [Naegleria gruberi strain NEG-M]
MKNNNLNTSVTSTTTTNQDGYKAQTSHVASSRLPTLDDFEPQPPIQVEMDNNCCIDYPESQQQQNNNLMKNTNNNQSFNKEIQHQQHHSTTLDTLSKVLTPRVKNIHKYEDGDGDDLESQNDHADCLQIRTGVRISEIITSIGWLIYAQTNPSTSISYIEQVPLNYPAVTICNWNAEYYCDYCNLTLKTCTMVNDTDGTIYECPFKLSETVIEQNGQVFQCYVFNNDTSKPLAVKTTGYGGSISMYFTLPPVKSDRDSRFGLQASFHEIGSIPLVFAETNFAIPYVDNFFTLTKIETNRLKSTEEYPLHSIHWDSRISNVQLTFKEDSIVVVSFAYSTLNIHQVSEIAGKTMLQLLGDLAGMLGVLLGIDILKALRGLLEIPQVIQQKSFRPIYELFN